jgi:predicted ATPase/DNA-binding SARP family transcriptional activator
MDARWRIEFLGGLRARQGDRVITRFRTQKTAALLAYLAYHRQQSHPRELLIDLLWPESEEREGRQSLRQALASLRRQLEPPGVPANAVIVADYASVRVNPVAVDTDVAELERLVAAAARAPGEGERIHLLSDAVALYQGEFLPGFYEDWCLAERERLAEVYLGALRQLVGYLEQEGDLARALHYARRATAASPLREEVHEVLIRLLMAAGELSAALRQFRHLEKLLQRELDEAPSPRLYQLADEIRRMSRRIARLPSSPAASTVRHPGDRPPGPATRRDLPPGVVAREAAARERPGAEPAEGSPLPAAPLPSGTVVLLVVRIEGLTEPRRDEPGLEDPLELCHALLRPLFRGHGGHELPESGGAGAADPGEEIQVAFGRASEALAAAVAARRRLREIAPSRAASEAEGSDLPEDISVAPPEAPAPKLVTARMALHIGEVEPGNTLETCPALTVAGRLLRAAHPGQILVSDAIADLVGPALDESLRLVDLGRYRLSPAAAPCRLFQIDDRELGRQTFPPPRATPVRSSHLPLPFTRLCGRDEEIARLRDLLLAPETRLVTLTGPGGVGKTRLAIAVGRLLADALAGGTCFVLLSDLSQAQRIEETILEAMGLSRAPDTDPLEQVIAALSQQRSLLILDNFERVLDPGTATVQTLLERVPQLVCLVTSRQRLAIAAEQECVVSPLPIPPAGVQAMRTEGEKGRRGEGESRQRHDGLSPGSPSPLLPFSPSAAEHLLLCPSVQLFVDRAQAVRPDFQLTRRNAAAVAALCRRLEGIPLAIELAAMRAQVVTPAQMLRQLERRFDFLVSRRRDVAPRHRSLRASFEWSYQLLSPASRRLLARLSIFRGGWTLDAAEAVCAESSPTASGDENLDRVIDSIAELLVCSLITTQESDPAMRFGMLESLREDAEERLAPEERADLARRHAAYYLALAEAAEPELRGPRQQEWLQRLETEHENMRAALSWSCGELAVGGWQLAVATSTLSGAQPSAPQPLPTANRPLPTALRLAGALFWFWRLRGHWSEGRHWLEQALAGAGPTNDQRPTTNDERPTINDEGRLDAMESQPDLALPAQSGLEQREGEAPAEPSAAEIDAPQARREPRPPSAPTRAPIFEPERAVARAKVLHASGVLAWFTGDHAAAQARLLESVALARSLNAPGIVAHGLSFLGMMRQSQGDRAAGRALYEESAVLCRAAGDRWGLALALTGLGTAVTRDDPDAARALHEESLALFRALGDPWGRSLALAGLGSLALRRGDLAAARTHYEECLSLRRGVGDAWHTAATLSTLGYLAQCQGDWRQAADHYAESLDLHRALADKRGTAASLRHLADAALEMGDLPQAVALYRESLTLYRDLAHPAGLLLTLAGLAHVAARESRRAEAGLLLGAAETLRETAVSALDPGERSELERHTAATVAALGVPLPDTWMRGRSMALDEVVSFALGESEPV